jgi:tol-pal system protein YbgF
MNTIQIAFAALAVTVLAACAGPGSGVQPEPRVSQQAVEKPPATLFSQLQQLRTEVSDLRNQVELQRHELDRLQQRQRQLYDDLDHRLRLRERQAPAASAPPSAATGPADAAAPGAQVDTPAASAPAAEQAEVTEISVSGTEEQQAYENAFNLLKQSRYGEAVQGFEEFIIRYPGSSLSGSAHYWIAEAHYVTREFQQALEEFDRFAQDYPDSDRLPDAQLKIGYIHLELGNRQEGRRALEDVIARYPGSRVAISARNRLKREAP